MRAQVTDGISGALILFGAFPLVAERIFTVTILSFTTRARRTHGDTLSIGDIADIGSIEAIFIATRPRRTFALDAQTIVITRIPTGAAVQITFFDALPGVRVAGAVIGTSIGGFAHIDAFSAITDLPISAGLLILAGDRATCRNAASIDAVERILGALLGAGTRARRSDAMSGNTFLIRAGTLFLVRTLWLILWIRFRRADSVFSTSIAFITGIRLTPRHTVKPIDTDARSILTRVIGEARNDFRPPFVFFVAGGTKECQGSSQNQYFS